MVNGEAGKGDRYRPYSPKAWDKAWLRVFGVPCWKCKTNGYIVSKLQTAIKCPMCLGNGYLERKRR